MIITIIIFEISNEITARYRHQVDRHRHPSSLKFQEPLIHALVSDIKLIVDGKEFHKKCFCCKKCSVQLEKVKHIQDCKLANLSRC